jgi:hypothetical protein
MRVPFKEPTSSKYIYINKETNTVHLLVPFVGGQEISTDNTCKRNIVLHEFFQGEAQKELVSYQKALVADIHLLKQGSSQLMLKEERLRQIEVYIDATKAMRNAYGRAVRSFIAKPWNLYDIQLRPKIQDPYSDVFNPVFTLNRKNDQNGTPLSALYNALWGIFSNIKLPSGPRSQLINRVLKGLPPSAGFEEVQQGLSEHCKSLFNLDIDFNKCINGSPATKAVLEEIMGVKLDKPEEYVEALLGACAKDLWKVIKCSFFYAVPEASDLQIRIEYLSICTQFFLATLNVYCKMKGLSNRNFGVILDNNPGLSQDLVQVISTALNSGVEVEEKVLNFFNEQAAIFGLTECLSPENKGAIKEKFSNYYATVTATKENPHMDDFIILDMEATGNKAKFVSYKGSICMNFAEIVNSALLYQSWYAQVRKDFENHPRPVPHKNEWVKGEINLGIRKLIKLDKRVFNSLPGDIQIRCRSYKTQLPAFLEDVAKGKQDKAEHLLTFTRQNIQILLEARGIFTDYAGKTFYCTAYEYAYWAKDTHMRRMLEKYMDEETKTYLLKRIDKMEKRGLTYLQDNQLYRSRGFNFDVLDAAWAHYWRNYPKWINDGDLESLQKAWLEIGKAQREVPAHVAQEFCGLVRGFSLIPAFDDLTLSRNIKFYNEIKDRHESWFPLQSPNSGLGFHFAIFISNQSEARGSAAGPEAGIDRLVLDRLAKIRTKDLQISREFLSGSRHELKYWI